MFAVIQKKKNGWYWIYDVSDDPQDDPYTYWWDCVDDMKYRNFYNYPAEGAD